MTGNGKFTTFPFACDHLSFAVGSDDGLWALKNRLSAAGPPAPGHGTDTRGEAPDGARFRPKAVS
jgi:hypothetical protein